MKRHGRSTPVRVAELLVGATLAHFLKPKLFKDSNNFSWFKYWNISHRSNHFYGLSADKFGFQLGIPIFQQHGDYFLQVAVEFVHCFRLSVCPGKARHKTDVKTRLQASFYDSRECFHLIVPLLGMNFNEFAE